ncbi:hypothetical protein LSAT2_009812, partial [Lamellibrachia satsuma]
AGLAPTSPARAAVHTHGTAVYHRHTNRGRWKQARRATASVYKRNASRDRLSTEVQLELERIIFSKEYIVPTIMPDRDMLKTRTEIDEQTAQKCSAW